jgi:hypothetical protein
MPAATNAPPGAASASKYLDNFRKQLLADLYDDLSSRVRQHRNWIVLLGVELALLSLAISVFTAIKLPYELPISKSVGNYCLVAAASMAGLFVSDLSLKAFAGPEDYKKAARDFSQPPFARALGTCIVAVIAALAVSSEFIGVSLGKWKSADLPTNPAIALLVGFIAGVPGSVIVRRLWKAITGDGGEVPGRRR